MDIRRRILQARIIWVFILGSIPFLPYLFGSDYLTSWDQVGAGGNHWLIDALKSFQLPLWNPYSVGGMPTWDAGFGDTFYPPYLITAFLFDASRVPAYYFLFHTLLAGVGAYYLAKRKTEGWWPLVFSVSYMLNPFYISFIYAGHTGKFAVISWLPWAFLASGRVWPLAAVILAMLLTSHLQMVYLVLAGLLLWFTFQSIANKNILILLKFLLAALMPLTLTAFLWLPPILYNATASVRGDAFHQSYAHATSWSMHLNDLKGLIWPAWEGIQDRYHGPNPFKVNTEYPGLALLILTGVAFFKARSKEFYFFLSLATLALLFSLGSHTPIHKLAYDYIPGFKNFRAPAMVMFWFMFSVWSISVLTASKLPQRFAFPILLFVITDLYFIHSSYFFKATQKTFQSDPIADYLSHQPKPFRVFAAEGCLPNGWSEYWGIETLNGFRDQEMAKFRSIRDKMVDGISLKDNMLQGSPLLDILDVHFVIYKKPEGLRLIRYRSSKGRAWIQGGKVTQNEYQYNKKSWDVDSPGGTLFISEIFFPHWKATIDGIPAQTRAFNNLITSIDIPPGKHTITMKYVSPWIRLGLTLSAISLSIILLITAYAYRLKLWPRMATIGMFFVKHWRF